MAYDEDLADRIRVLVGGERGVSEKRMFGGLAYLVNGNMAVAASTSGGLLLRCDPADQPTHLEHRHAAPFRMRGRDMTGWLRIDPAGLDTDDELAGWVEHGLRYARSLPPK